MKPVRPGPFTRGLFPGPKQNAGPSQIGYGIDSRLSDSPYYRKWNSGHLDLPVNVALLALAASAQVYVARAAVVVTAPTKPWTPVEQPVNVAVRQQLPTVLPTPQAEPTYFKRPAPQVDLYPNIAITVPPPIRSAVEPTFTRRLPPQIDSFPNLAALATGPVYRPPAALDVPVAKRSAPQVDLPPNLAVQPAFTEPNPRQPLYVTTGWKQWPQPDVLPNVTVRIAGPVYVPPAPLEPTLAKRLAPQPEVYPNVTVQFQQTRLAGTYLDPITWRTKPAAPEVFPNLAALVQAPTYAPPPALDVPAAKRAPVTPDLFPNLAVLPPPPVGVVREPIEPQLTRKPVAPPDVYPNVAASIPFTEPLPRTPFVVTAPWKGWAPVDAPLPNVAARTVVQAYAPVPLVEPVLWKGRAPQIDLFTNVAVMLQPAVGNITTFDTLPVRVGVQPDLYPNLAAATYVLQVSVPPPLVEPVLWKARPPQIDGFTNVAVMLQPAVGNITAFDTLPVRATLQPDLFPNLAVLAQPPAYVPAPLVEPIIRRALLQIDLYPNLAVRVAPAPTPLIEPIDPWITKRYPPQVDVYQNQAIYVVEIARAPFQQSPDPTYTKNPPLQLDLFPNIAATAPPPAPGPPEIYRRRMHRRS
jgi:hypothetical protein